MEEVNETVGVEVGFWGRKIWPMRFVWGGKRHEVRRVTIRFERRDGGRRYLCFGVETAGMVAELALDRDDLTWKLKEVGST